MREGSDLDSFSFLSIPRVARQVTFFKSLRLQLSRTFILTVNFLFACRIFSIRRCARCGAGIGSSDLVMRARDLIFHVNCFSCALCGLPLSAGDTAGIRGGRVFCCEHYETELQLWVLRKFILWVSSRFFFFPIKWSGKHSTPTNSVLSAHNSTERTTEKKKTSTNRRDNHHKLWRSTWASSQSRWSASIRWEPSNSA